MSQTDGIKFRDNFLYWGLLIFVTCVFVFPTPKGSIASLQVPSFALLLLILIQILFPQFRFSKTANIIATLVIIALGILKTLPN